MTPAFTELDRAGRATRVAVDAVLEVVGLALNARSEGRLIHPDELLLLAQEANDASRRANRLLTAAGAGGAGGCGAPGMSRVAPIPLEFLDTSETRRLLYLLEQAQEVAERIDAQRGRSLGQEIELLPGESRGTDLAESISEIALRMRTEVHGPRGRE